MKNILVVLLAVLINSHSIAQGAWTATSAPVVDFRYDDIYFLNPDTGWAISLYDSYTQIQQGTVLKTTDGGTTWQTLIDSSKAVFRDVGFLDSQVGFIGTLTTGGTAQDTIILYETMDGTKNGALTIEDGTGFHTSAETRGFQYQHNILQID